jgi:phytoene synthase
MDLDRRRYETFDELVEYCARVAGAVGIACMGVYGADQPQRAEQLGIALQLINIMRDVREDWELGRVYLPQGELASFGVTEQDIAEGRVTPAWQALMAYQAARARDYLENGLRLLDHLDRRSSACVATFAGLYRATLERIEADGFDVFDGPPRLSMPAKLRIVAASLLS